MRIDLRLLGIVVSMVVVISLALDFKKKIESFNTIHQSITNDLYNLKQNIYEHSSIINTAIINLAFNNDTFVENYKKFKTLQKKIENNTELKRLYPIIYKDLQVLFKQQINIFEKTDKFLITNAKVKNSLAILYKRLNLKYDEQYNKNFIKFLTNSIYQQTNILRHNSLDKTLYKYFLERKDLNMDYRLNFIHIKVLFTEIPQLKKTISEIMNNPATTTLEKVFKRLKKEALHQKRSMNSKLYMITAGAVLFFVVILFLARDIKLHVQRLREKDKLIFRQSKHAAMGEMIDAIAHQWKQPINIIKIRVEFLTFSKENNKDISKEDYEEFQNSVNKQLDHMTNTLDEFRGFLRPNKTTKIFSVEKSTRSVLLLLKDELIKYNIQSEIQLLNDVQIDGIENEFKHVLINLINNAKDAFIENNIEKRKISITIDNPKIFVKDNAGGIPTHIIDKIFEPNFTTKDEDKGTGIGLYMTKQILEKINTKIGVMNEGKGACFIITTLLK